MKPLLFFFSASTLSLFSYGQNFTQNFIASDINNFWKAYDKIVATKDSMQQVAYLKELYLDKGSPGLKSLLAVRGYTSKEFIDAINNFPKFWASVRSNTINTNELYTSIETDIRKLKEIYPDLKPSTIYFLIGAFRTGGTIQEDRVLIGSELSLADNATMIEEHPQWRQAFYKEYEPRQNIALLCTHEYIHTQQKPFVENLLSTCLYEGVAEFISCLATGKQSNSPAIAFGKKNREKVVEQFVADLFLMSNNSSWLWGENRNELKVRDLGYYIGYEICERYYNLSDNKTKAVKELIELDFTNEAEVERIVDVTRLLPKPLQALNEAYEKERPTVVALNPFSNGSKEVSPGWTKITVTFSEPLNGYHTSIDFGPLGEQFFPKMRERIWASDASSWSFEADLQPGRRYQILISNNFRKQNGIRLKPYLIDFTTAEK